VIRLLLAVSSVVYLSSALDPCNLDLPGYDAGSGGDDSSAPSGTIGEQCTSIVTEFCQQSVSRCALQGFDVSDCVTSDMPQCCSAGNTCDEKTTQPQSAVDSCKSDIDAEDCNAVVNSTLPSSCQGLLSP
jgi:hypothetical protein